MLSFRSTRHVNASGLNTEGSGLCRHVIVARSPKVARGTATPLSAPSEPRYHCDFCGHTPDHVEYPIDLDSIIPCSKDRPSTIGLTGQIVSYVLGKINSPTMPDVSATHFRQRLWLGAMPAKLRRAVPTQTTEVKSETLSSEGSEVGSRSTAKIASVTDLMRYTAGIRRVNAVLRRHVFDSRDEHLHWMSSDASQEAAARGRQAIPYAAVAYGVPYRGGYFNSMGAFTALTVAKQAVITPSVPDQRLAIAGMLQVPVDDVVHVHNPAFPKDCSSVVIVAHADRLVVLTFRGTITTADMLTDILCDPAEIQVMAAAASPDSEKKRLESFSAAPLSFVAADGFVSCAKNAQLSVLDALLETAAKFPEYRILVTGHSLGAAVAQLAFVSFVQPIFGARAECCVFGPPPAASDELCRFVSARGDEEPQRRPMMSFVYGLDVIPRLQARSLRRLFDVAAAGAAKEISTAQLAALHEASLREAAATFGLPRQSSSVSGGNTSAADASLNAPRPALCEYYIPGTIVQLQRAAQHYPPKCRLALIDRSHISLAFPIVCPQAMSDHFLRPTAQALLLGEHRH